ncbi:RNase H domain-containing protein [Trichonephila clavipes]|uniref:RNase H domain-containing protein n=1 Tax=Trichonephila clavipes TaxID=2585209 RepID=A0A8X6V276_TRICX|nr:RNase H domain-containing protein [Trichonephila clavipes]
MRINGSMLPCVLETETMISELLNEPNEVLMPHVYFFLEGSGDKFVFMEDYAQCHRRVTVKLYKQSALEAIQGIKTRLNQDVNSFLLCIEETGKSCTLQWIPDHVDTKRKELANSLAKEGRTIEPAPLSTTGFDANAVAKQKALLKPRKISSLPESSHNRKVTTALRTKHFKDMDILPDGSRT